MNEPKSPRDERGVDWSLTTWEGVRREQTRRWAVLPLERAIMALEEMEALARELQAEPRSLEESGGGNGGDCPVAPPNANRLGSRDLAKERSSANLSDSGKMTKP